jgi:F0F1-type ATP synthase membrane subunit b/b'
MENMKNDNKDKIPEDEMKKIDDMLTEAKSLKDKEDATKEDINKEIEKYTKEFQELMSKYAAVNNSANPNPADVIEDESNNDSAPEAEVIDADEDKK